MHVREHAHGGIRVGEGDDHRGGAREPGGDQRFAPGAVGEHHGVARRGGLAHPLRVEVERNVAHALGGEQARKALAVAAIAQDDDVALRLDGLHRDAVQRERAQHPFGARHAHHDPVARLDEKRRGEHRQDHRREQEMQEALGHDARAARERQQHETELSGLREREPYAQRGSRGGAEGARQRRDQRELAGDERGEEGKHRRELVQHDAQVEHHADGDEEKAQQHVAEGLDVLLDLEAVLGLRDQHAREKGAEHHREPGEAGEIGHQQDDEQHVEHEQLVRAPPRHHAEPGAHQARAGEDHDGERCGGLAERDRDRHPELLGRAAERRDHDQQRHHR